MITVAMREVEPGLYSYEPISNGYGMFGLGYTDPQTGKVYELAPGGGYWIETYSPTVQLPTTGAVALPPSNLPESISLGFTTDAVALNSARSQAISNDSFNRNMLISYETAMSYWIQGGRRGPQPEDPARYILPTDFNVLYDYARRGVESPKTAGPSYFRVALAPGTVDFVTGSPVPTASTGSPTLPRPPTVTPGQGQSSIASTGATNGGQSVRNGGITTGSGDNIANLLRESYFGDIPNWLIGAGALVGVMALAAKK